MQNIRNNPWFRFAVRFLGTVTTLGVFFALAPKIFAQGGEPPKIEDVAATAGEVKTALNIMWMLVAGFLVFFMQAGFALVEVGFTRAKNAAHTMAMNITSNFGHPIYLSNQVLIRRCEPLRHCFIHNPSKSDRIGSVILISVKKTTINETEAVIIVGPTTQTARGCLY